MSHSREVQWYVAKYVPDLMRNEPRNIGLVLRLASASEVGEANSVRWRFIKPAPDFVKAKNNYGAWIEYWENTLRKYGSKALHWLPRPKMGDNYYMVFAGARMVGGDPDFDALFDRLVGDPHPDDGDPEKPPPPKKE